MRMLVLPRRRFLQGTLALAGSGLMSGCGIAPLRAPARMHRVGFLANDLPDSSFTASHNEAFREALSGLGYVEGRNLALEWRFGQEASELAAFATEFVALAPEVIVAAGDPAIRVLHGATSTIPIVIIRSGDPVASGYVASLARPGGNITGLSLAGTQLAGKRLDLLTQAFPGTSRVGILWSAPASQPSSGTTSQSLQFREAEEAARALGVQVQSLAVQAGDDFGAALDRALESAIYGRAEALFVIPSGRTTSHGRRIADFAARHRLPTMFGAREDVLDVDGLMAYGVSLTDLYRQAAVYVDKILKGARPADLPVQQPTRFDFVINLRTAQALGMTIPPPVLIQATEVIQ